LLDKSVPFIDVLMHRPPGIPPEPHALPAGYTYSLFSPGDEVSWAQIEASVLEFDSEIEALLYFQRYRLPYLEELCRRCVFIKSPTGERVATASAWWGYTDMRRDPWLHWVAVKPAFQGKGLGKAIIACTVHLLLEIEGDRDFYLHTQTWSHKAIALYERAGFAITDEPGLGDYPNDRYAEAVSLLRKIRRKENRHAR
jgi:GNAT superfamily N-acetyltransferase